MVEFNRLGPDRRFQGDWPVPGSDEIVPGFWYQAIMVEALGTDGNWHMASASLGIDYVDELVEQFFLALEASLTNQMREKGVLPQ